MAERRGRERFVCEQPPYSLLVRGIEADVLPTCLRYGMGVIPWSPLAGGWLSGALPQGRRPAADAAAPSACPRRYDMSLPGQPAQARGGRRARGRLAEEAGMTPHPPGARVRDPPPGGDRGDHRPADDGAARVASSAPPTSRCPDDVLDRIDEIVPPGVNLNPADAGYDNPALRPEALRR